MQTHQLGLTSIQLCIVASVPIVVLQKQVDTTYLNESEWVNEWTLHKMMHTSQLSWKINQPAYERLVGCIVNQIQHDSSR